MIGRSLITLLLRTEDRDLTIDIHTYPYRNPGSGENDRSLILIISSIVIHMSMMINPNHFLTNPKGHKDQKREGVRTQG